MRELTVEDSNYPLIEYEPAPLEGSHSYPEDSEMPHSSKSSQQSRMDEPEMEKVEFTSGKKHQDQKTQDGKKFL